MGTPNEAVMDVDEFEPGTDVESGGNNTVNINHKSGGSAPKPQVRLYVYLIVMCAFLISNEIDIIYTRLPVCYQCWSP